MLQDFYRDGTVRDNNFKNMSVPLELNCTGHEAFDRPLTARSVRQDIYLFYLSEGELEVTAPCHLRLSAGEAILFAPDTPYAYRSCSAHTSHYFAHFTGYAAADVLSMCALSYATPFRVGRTEAIEACFEAIFRTFLTRDALFDVASAAKLLVLLVALGHGAQGTDTRPSGGRLLTSLGYLHASYAAPITVRALADMEYLSESRYRALFREVTGKSPTEYLAALRLRAACELLELTEMPVGEVAAAVGYPDARYFSRLFRGAYAMTPRAYRNACTKGRK